MSNFEPNKRHLREALLFCFHLKKTAAEAHRMLVEAYGTYAASETTCRDWFRRFKDGDFEVEDHERSGRPKLFEDEELEALLDQDPSQTQEELAETLAVDRTTIAKRLHAIGMTQKEGHWVPYQLKLRDVERRFMTCEILLQRQNRKGFLHRVVTGDEKWIHHSNPKRKKVYARRGKSPSTSTGTPRPNIHGGKVMLCVWWDQKGILYYELLQPGQTVNAQLYRQQLLRLSRAIKEKRPEFAKRHDKVIFQHDNARPHVAKPVKDILETLGWDVLPHPPYSPDIAPSDYHLFRSMAHGLADRHFSNDAEVQKWLDEWIASKDEEFFRNGIRQLPERWAKVLASDGQYFH